MGGYSLEYYGIGEQFRQDERDSGNFNRGEQSGVGEGGVEIEIEKEEDPINKALPPCFYF